MGSYGNPLVWRLSKMDRETFKHRTNLLREIVIN